MSGSKNSINGSVTGVGIVTGGEVTQIFNNEHKTPPQLTSKLGKSTIIGKKRASRDRPTAKQLKHSASYQWNWWGKHFLTLSIL